MSKANAGLVWILSGVALLIYGSLYQFGISLPGFEELIDFLTTINGVYIFAAAFILILIEGTYIVGNFFPGASLVAILAILSGSNGPFTFLLTIVAIFVGWNLAGVINVYIAKTFKSAVLHEASDLEYEYHSRPYTSWFPSFCANHEVAQIVEGGSVRGVLLTSLKIKFFTCAAAAVFALIMPFFKDVQDISNEEGMITLIVFAVVSLGIGFYKLREAKSTK